MIVFSGLKMITNITYRDVNQALMLAKAHYEGSANKSRLNHNHEERLRKLALASGRLIELVTGREGDVVGGIELTITEAEFAQMVGVSPTTLRVSYLPSIYSKSDLPFSFKFKKQSCH